MFSILDYLSRWVQERRRAVATLRVTAHRAGRSPSEVDEANTLALIDGVDSVITSIPANIIAQRAIECGSYARALFHWENFIREQSETSAISDAQDQEAMYHRLQSIYTQIDEPDGLEGISAKLNILTPEQQALQHRRAGQWSAAQSWYELELMNKPSDRHLQLGLLSCLKESGQYSRSSFSLNGVHRSLSFRSDLAHDGRLDVGVHTRPRCSVLCCSSVVDDRGYIWSLQASDHEENHQL